jgi:hypothetical protein
MEALNMELKPCPFCGSQAFVSDGRPEYGFYACCAGEDCYATVGEVYDNCAMPDHMFRTPEEAAEAWNRRPPPSGGTEDAGAKS